MSCEGLLTDLANQRVPLLDKNDLEAPPNHLNLLTSLPRYLTATSWAFRAILDALASFSFAHATASNTSSGTCGEASRRGYRKQDNANAHFTAVTWKGEANNAKIPTPLSTQVRSAHTA